MAGLVAGVDEAGRGALAGPVMAAAVVFAAGQQIAGVGDSKQIAAAVRTRLAAEIKSQAVAWHVALASVAEITRLNILQATLLAMQRAVLGLQLPLELVRVDGNKKPELAYPTVAVVGGDALLADIGAASILAKTHRDEHMKTLDARYPGYGFGQHKGYGTKAHRAAILRQGPSPCHRPTFAPMRHLLS